MKRSLDEYESGPGDDKRSRVYGEVPLEEVTMTIRVLILVRESGLVIGKAGANIRKIRETTGADVRLAEAPQGSTRRGASCTGSPAQVSAAVISILETLQNHNPDAPQEADTTQPAITLLIGNEVVGAIIGKGGQVIANTRDTSGCAIKVSEKPIEGSTEKSVDLKGSVAACSAAIDMIVKQVATMAEKETRAVPLTKIEWGSPAAIQNYFNPPPPPPSYDSYGGYGGGGGGGGGYGYRGPPPPRDRGGERRQVVVPVASGLAGSLIGKGGNTIRRIREVSGAEVKIAEPTPGSDTRNVTITGSEATTHHAVSMVYSALGQPSPYGPSPSPPAPPGPCFGGGRFY